MNLSRRRFLAMTGTVGAAGGIALAGCGDGESAGTASTDGDVVAFHGRHQAGIVTPVQDRVHLAAFDVTTTSRAQLVALFAAWTEAAAQMTQGHDVGRHGAVDGPALAPPEDTGEALGLRPGRLTITFGVGPTLFEDAGGHDRFGLAARRPAALQELPHFPGDQLDPARSGGDLCVQACSDDPQIAVHAIRNLARIGFGTVAMRWSQLGFGRTSSTSDAQVTPRNLFGFKDGTRNITAEHPDLVDEFVWVAPDDDPAANWLAGGSYLVVRRINMHIETWDRTSLREQEQILGRAKGSGAPLSGGTETTAPDFAALDGDGGRAIADRSHLRLAHPDSNGGTHILRRGYNFTDGSDALGRMDAGLLFLAYTRDPVRHFVPMQNNLAKHDALSEYTQHTASGLFAVPAGVAPGEHVGAALFAD